MHCSGYTAQEECASRKFDTHADKDPDMDRIPSGMVVSVGPRGNGRRVLSLPLA